MPWGSFRLYVCMFVRVYMSTIVSVCLGLLKLLFFHASFSPHSSPSLFYQFFPPLIVISLEFLVVVGWEIDFYGIAVTAAPLYLIPAWPN